jgi:hypothetical protein
MSIPVLMPRNIGDSNIALNDQQRKQQTLE